MSDWANTHIYIEDILEKFFFSRDWNQNIDQEKPDGLKKKFSVIVSDKEQIIGGRTEDEAIFQPVKHLSGL